VAFDGNDIYVKGIAMWFPEAWLKGTIQGNKVVFASGQFVGEDEYGPEYIIATVDGENVAPEFTFDYNAETKTLTLGEYLVVESAKKDEIYAYGYWQGLTIYQGEIIVPEPVVVPDGLETEVYTFSAQELQFDEQDNPVYEPISFDVNVGFNGNDVYVQGMAQKASFEYLTDAWVKGTMQDGVATFATGQFYGTVMDQYNFFFLGYFHNFLDFYGCVFVSLGAHEVVGDLHLVVHNLDDVGNSLLRRGRRGKLQFFLTCYGRHFLVFCYDFEGAEVFSLFHA
jgi:hypothetical protein